MTKAMNCVFDVTALHYLSVRIPKYQGSPVVHRNDIQKYKQEFVHKSKQCENFYTDIGSLVLHQVINHQLEECLLRTTKPSIDTRDDVRLPQTPQNPFESFLRDKETKRAKLRSKRECTFCGKILSTETAKKVHERTQHKEGGHTCSHCGKYFRIKVNGITHEKRMHKTEESSTKPFKCETCSQGFTKEFNYDQHMKRHVSGELDLVNSEQTCDICENTYKSKRDLSRHYRRMHGSNLWISYTCQYCGKFFNRKSDGQVHERKVHRLLVEENKHFKCHFCIRGFDTEKFRQLHEENHNLGELNCKSCGKQFYYRAQCKTHEVLCGGTELLDDDSSQDLFICHYCNKTFARKGSLLPHFASHFPICTFSCELCGREFKRKESLKRHLVALHSKQKADSLIQCKVCAKILSTMAALKRHHRQTHYLGRKIYESQCPKDTSLGGYRESQNEDEVKTEDVKGEHKDEMFVVGEQDVAQTIEVYSVMIVP